MGARVFLHIFKAKERHALTILLPAFIFTVSSFSTAWSSPQPTLLPSTINNTTNNLSQENSQANSEIFGVGNATEDGDPLSIKEQQTNKQDEESKLIAQAATSNTQPIDLAPVKLPERTKVFGNFDSFKTNLLYRLPARVFVNASCENTLRLETNVLQTSSRYRADMIYRVLPNVTIGYALTKNTRFGANYFFFRDQYTRNSHLLSRNIHSIGFRIDHDIPVNERTTITTSFFARQLLLSHFQPLSDLLPSVSIVRRVGSRAAVYTSVLGQIRFRNTLGKFQEGDQFYSLGAVYRTYRWTFLSDNTLVTNFGNRNLRGGPNNQVIVMTLESDYKLHPKLPVIAFIRAEPIFNIGANSTTGFAGFNFRIFGGLRVEVNKPPIFPIKLKRR